MTGFRNILRLLSALPLLLVLVAAPAAAETVTHADATYATADSQAQPSKSADHASKKARVASLEEFFEIDDDAEQDFKPLAAVTGFATNASPVAGRLAASYRAAPPSHRACAPFPTGPPHA